LALYLKDKRLTEHNAVFSRTNERAYVQDKTALDCIKLRHFIEHDAQIFVCGRRKIANSVKSALNEILAALGIDAATVKT